MLLSEMFEVREGQLFTTENYSGYEFCIESCGGVEHVKVKRESGEWFDINLTMMEILIHLAPSGIIHLPPPLTDEQREQLKAIWTLGGRWLAKDMPGDTFAFGYKPVKDMEWLSWIMSNDDKDENLFSVYRDLDVCSLVSWSDPEPYDIAKALGVEG